jgi:hypothetical protein
VSGVLWAQLADDGAEAGEVVGALFGLGMQIAVASFSLAALAILVRHVVAIRVSLAKRVW